MRKKLILVVAFVLIAVALLGTSVVMAQSGGKKGKAQTGCKNCHGNTAGTSTTSITGPTDAVKPDSQDHIITVTVGNWPGTYGGLDVEATDGTFTVGGNTKTMVGEIVHTDELSRTWIFTWTAPATVGQYTLWVSGLAADGTGGSDLDSWKLSSLTIDVVAWESYQTNAYSTVWGTPADHYDGSYYTAFMNGEGFIFDNSYKIGYYDADGDIALVETQSATSGGVLTGEYILTTDTGRPAGLWHAVVIDTVESIPTTYADALLDANYVVDDDFEVNSDAIPEFPSALASISVLGLCTAVYLYFRRQATFNHLPARQTPL